MAIYLDLKSLIFIFLYFVSDCHGETCYQYYIGVFYSYYYNFYCCGKCTGYTYQLCEDDGAYYSYSYDFCVSDDAKVGVIVGIVIGSLVGVALLVGGIIFLCCVCKTTTAQRGNIIAPASQAPGVAVVSTSNTNNQPYQAGYMMQPMQPMYPNQSLGQPMPVYKSPEQQMPMYPYQSQQNPVSQTPQQSLQPQQSSQSQQLKVVNNPPPSATTYGSLPPPMYAETTA